MQGQGHSSLAKLVIKKNLQQAITSTTSLLSEQHLTVPLP